MSKFLKMAASAALLTGFAATSAFAGTATVGTITNVSGDILVERNGEYFTATNEAGIIAGDKVFATSGAFATLTKDNCAIDLNSNNVVTIGEAGDCSTVLLAEASASTEFAAPSVASLNAAPTVGTLLLFAAGTAAAVVVIDEVTSDGNDNPGSPG